MKIINYLIITFCIIYLATAIESSFAVTLTVESVDGMKGDVAFIDITVDDPSEISGAAFTVTYDRSALNIDSIESGFFGTFKDQFEGVFPKPLTNVDVDGENYNTPFLFRSVSEGVMIAAARQRAGESKNTLFTIKFFIKKEGVHEINILKSHILYTNAGYKTGGESIPYLIGAKSFISDSEALETFFEIPVDSIISGVISVAFSCPKDGDVNQDGELTTEDALLAFKYSLGQETLSECGENHADVNNDEEVTSGDALCIFEAVLNGVSPKEGLQCD